jgi:peptidyl-prolyl cis-trans isomerase SurA
MNPLRFLRLLHACLAPLAFALIAAGTAHAQTSGAAAADRAKPEEIDRVIAVVNSDVVTASELRMRIVSVERQLRRQNIEIPPADVLRSQVLERLITDRAQVQLARDYGMRVDEAQIDRAVANIADQNRMTVVQLRDRLDREGVSMGGFRDDLRSEILIQRLREREVDSKIQISEADIDAFLAEQNETPADGGVEYNLAHILLRVPEGASAEQIGRQRFRGEELIRQLERGVDFGRLAASFSDAPEAMSGGGLGWRSQDRLPQLFVEAVARLRPGQVSGLLRSPNGFHVLKLLDRRGAPVGRLGGVPVAQTRARHILIRQTELVSEGEALRRLREIKQRIEQGTASFEDMARQYSADGSAASGGDLGWVYQGDTVPEFERAMDALAPGKVSEPVRTTFGWHLIQVQERRTDEASPDRVRQQARMALRERRLDEAHQEWLRQVRDRAYVEYRLE